jgi:chemotaxis protein methyltransferase CheR
MSAAALPAELRQAQFEAIRDLVRDHTGIDLQDGKLSMVYARLLRRLRALALADFDAYLHVIEHDEAELARFINAMTTNVTSFFREPHHFELLRDVVVPQWLACRRGDALRVWSAGCATGEEPYSIAMTLAEALEHRGTVRILATDLDSDVLAQAQAGWYDEEQVAGLSPARVGRWLVREDTAKAKGFRVRDELRRLVIFRQLNLMHRWPVRPGVDVIFCRNVMIYFRRETQRALIERFAALQAPGGCLCVGHAESLLGIAPEYAPIGRTAYRRRD